MAATLLVDLAITNANIQLTPLTGYMEKYVAPKPVDANYRGESRVTLSLN